MAFCENCGKKLETEDKYCEECARELASAPEEEAATAPQNEEKPAKKHPIINLRKIGIIAGAIIVVAAVIAIIIACLSGKDTNENFALYVQDNELYYTDTDGGTQRVSTNLFDCSDPEALYLASWTYLSEDGKTLFYPDKITDGDADSAPLYCRKLNKEGSEKKIADDVVLYTVDKKAKLVTYINDEGELYQYNIKKDSKDKLATDVKQFYVTEDGKKIAWYNNDSEIFVKEGKSEKLIEAKADGAPYFSRDLNTAYFLSEDALCKIADGGEKITIAKDVHSVLKIYPETNEIYYVTEQENTLMLKDFVNDDKKEDDENVKKPLMTDFTSLKDYSKATDEYLNAQARNSIRESLEEAALKTPVYTLFYYDGSNSNAISDSYLSGYTHTAGDKAVITYAAYKTSKVEKVKLSDYKTFAKLKIAVSVAITDASEMYVAAQEKAQVTAAPVSGKASGVTNDGSAYYYLDEKGNMYKVGFENGVPAAAEKYDSDVYNFELFGDKVVVYKQAGDNALDLYIDGKKLDTVDLTQKVTYNEYADIITYYTGWSKETSTGTLNVYQNGKAKKVADGVHSCMVIPNGKVLYIADYTEKYGKGALYISKGKKSEKTADDVSTIIPPYSVFDEYYRGSFSALYNL